MTKIAVFASGTGTNFEAIVKASLEGVIPCQVALLVCDVEGAKVIEKGARFGIEAIVTNPKKCGSKADYEAFLVEKMRQAGIELICLAGYMRIVGETLLQAYQGKIVNIHPALLPSFKGAHAIDDAFNFGVKVYGVTVHLIDETVDGGTIVMQRGFEYYGNDRDEVEAKIHAIEHVLYPEAICKILKK